MDCLLGYSPILICFTVNYGRGKYNGIILLHFATKRGGGGGGRMIMREIQAS